MSGPSLATQQLRRNQLYINEAVPKELDAMLTRVVDKYFTI
jgi:hypothetical protein